MSRANEEPMLRMVQRLVLAYAEWNVASRALRSVTVNQDLVLMHLMRAPATSAELCRRIGITSASMTHIVAGLEERGLLRRLPDESDRRRVLLHVTDQAVADVDRVAQSRELTDIYQAYGLEEQAAIASFLEQATQQLESAR